MTQPHLSGTQSPFLQPSTFRTSSTAPRIVATTTTTATTTPTAIMSFSTHCLPRRRRFAITANGVGARDVVLAVELNDDLDIRWSVSHFRLCLQDLARYIIV